jgi:crotonobetainyl-CoA:carnitine CoA-transferase CaiB-like acyl-CoA transferase
VQFDDQLRGAFRRQEPDAAFAARTMAVIRSKSREDRGRRHLTPVWLAVAAAVLLALGGINAALNHQRGIQARQDVELALRIASQTLNHVQLKLEAASEKKGMPDGR